MGAARWDANNLKGAAGQGAEGFGGAAVNVQGVGRRRHPGMQIFSERSHPRCSEAWGFVRLPK